MRVEEHVVSMQNALPKITTQYANVSQISMEIQRYNVSPNVCHLDLSQHLNVLSIPTVTIMKSAETINVLILALDFVVSMQSVMSTTTEQLAHVEKVIKETLIKDAKVSKNVIKL